MGAIRVGTSGWHYGHWKGRFYPEELSPEEWLGYYAGRFSTVEINNTFYQLPGVEIFVQWREAVPAGFQFAVKASRYLTHMKKLKDPQQAVAHFLEGVRALGDRRGPVLFQLPPNWKVNVERLRSFLAVLPSEGRYAFEFRHASWFDERVYEVLGAAGAAFCIHDLAAQPSPKVVTADFVYVRLHGAHGPYQGSYGQQALAGWAGAFSTWAGQGKEVYCYFNNDERGYAVQNARTLLDIIGQAG